MKKQKTIIKESDTNIKEDSKIDSFFNSDIHITGKYGEDIVISNIDNSYSLSCFELGIDKIKITEKEEKDIYNKYVLKGVSDFYKMNLDRIKSRAVNMGSRLSRFYNLYKQIPNDIDYQTDKLRYSFEIHRILENSLVLELTLEQYKNWFLFYEKGKNDEYVQIMLELIDDIKMQRIRK